MRICGALALTALLTGCITPETVPQPAPPPPARIEIPEVEPPRVVIVETPAPLPEETRQLTELLTFAQRIGQLNGEEYKRELNTATQGFNRDKSVNSRLRLALLLSWPGGMMQDDARALALLEPYANATANAGALRQLASLIHLQLTERARAQKRADQLKDQLDALRAIERSIIERGQQPPLRNP